MKHWWPCLVLVTFLAHSQCSRHPGIRDAGAQTLTVLHDQDFVAVMPSFQARIIVPYGTRAWRGSIRTIIGLNDTRFVDFMNEAMHEAETAGPHEHPYRERYVYFPDDPPEKKKNLIGDPRAAFMPAFAHLLYEQEGYKWILYGDDDTFFFMHHVKQLLAHYDHNQPYIIADTFVGGLFDQPRCLPCHLATAANEERIVNSKWVKEGKPRPEFACPYCTHKKSCLYKKSPDEDRNCGVPYVWGGFGAILSVGLMRQLNITEFDHCCKNDPGSGGDQKFSNCLMHMLQIGVTDPGASVLSDFNPDRRVFGGKDPRWYIDCFNKAADGFSQPLEPDCKFALKQAISAHVSAGGNGNNRSAAMMYELEAAFKRAIQFQGMKYELDRNLAAAAAAKAET